MGKQIIKGIAQIALVSLMLSAVTFAQDSHRPVKEQAKPTYPELAKRMNVSGTVKVEVAVAANGTVKSAKALGGHPLLIDTAVSAAKKFKFESGSESTETIVFNFNPNN
jgi:TonB family protein